MSESASKESKQIPANVVQFVPREDATWRQKTAQHAQQVVGSSFTEEHATPAASQPVPHSQELEWAGAERVGAEPTIDTADITDRAIRVASIVTDKIIGREGLLAHEETASGRKGVAKWKERVHRLLKRAA